MILTTKYNVGDKVFYYIKQLNAYAWGKIETVEVVVDSSVPKVSYSVGNRFYDGSIDRILYWPYPYYTKDYRDERYVGLVESEAYASPEELINDLNKKHIAKMEELKEVKKGWFK